jgi:hypothetical protein
MNTLEDIKKAAGERANDCIAASGSAIEKFGELTQKLADARELVDERRTDLYRKVAAGETRHVCNRAEFSLGVAVTAYKKVVLEQREAENEARQSVEATRSAMSAYRTLVLAGVS